ncbi:MAG: YlmH/Sll1252 family protein [Emergencia sp.]
MKEDNYLLGQIEDKISACDNKYIMTNTGFLDSHQQSVARVFCKKNHIPVHEIEFGHQRGAAGTETGGAGAGGSGFGAGFGDSEAGGSGFGDSMDGRSGFGSGFATGGGSAGAGGAGFGAGFGDSEAGGSGFGAAGAWNSGADQENLPPVRTSFYGGYEDAERVILINMPDYFDLDRDNPLCVIRAEKAPGSRELTHRDYLGSLLGLGLKRDMIGDIIVREDGADIIVMEDIADFILMNYYKAGRTNLSVSRLPISGLILQEHKKTIVTDTVASLRLDSVIASAFGLSRGKASEAITRGIVFVNNMEVIKTDYQVAEGDKLTLRGKGKAVLAEVGGRSRKDRQYITIERY